MDFAAQVDERLHNLAKPPGSLGLLEQQVRQVFLAWGSFQEELRPRHIIFAADNGVVRSGVVAQLSDITYMQSVHMTEGTSAVTCFCRCNGIPYEVVDVGIDSEDAVGVDRKIARGTADFSVQPAMTTEQFTRAAAVGRERVEAAKARGCNILSFGEMGIGNTTTSAAVLTALLTRHTSSPEGRTSPSAPQALGSAFPGAVRGAGEGMLHVCGFVVFFLVLTRLLTALTGLEHPFPLGLLELTGGILRLSGTRGDFVLAAALMGWGGVCVHCQTAAVLEGSGHKQQLLELRQRWRSHYCC